MPHNLVENLKIKNSRRPEKDITAIRFTFYLTLMAMSGVKRKAVTQDLTGRKLKGNKKSKVDSRSVRSAPRYQTSEEDSPGELVESDTTETEFSEPEPFENGSSGDLIESDTTETEVFEGFDDEKADEETKARERRRGGAPSSKNNVPSKTSKKSDAQNVISKSMHASEILRGHGSPGLTVYLGTSSKEAHAKQKAITQERKAAKPNAPQIDRSKKIWERLRRKSHVPLEERKKLVAELFKIVTGHFKDFVFKHDAVRVVQTAVKYGNLEQRKMIAKELKGDFKSLAESKYAKFLIGKLLVHGLVTYRNSITCIPLIRHTSVMRKLGR